MAKKEEENEKIRTFDPTEIQALGNAIDAAHPYSAVHAKSLFPEAPKFPTGNYPANAFIPQRGEPPATIQWKKDSGFLLETAPQTGSTAATPNYRLCLDEGIEVNDSVGEWKFKSSPHYIKRAIRIPYMYYAPSRTESSEAGSAILTKDYLIIAYEGGGGY